MWRGTTFQGPDGYYKLRIHYLDEPDGVSNVSLAVGDRTVGSWRFDGIVVSSLRWKEFDGVHIKHGETIKLTGRQGGYEYCRMMGLEILPSHKQAAEQVEAVKPREYSQDLVPLADYRELALDTSSRIGADAADRDRRRGAVPALSG